MSPTTKRFLLPLLLALVCLLPAPWARATTYYFDVSQDNWSASNTLNLVSAGTTPTLVSNDVVEFFSSTADATYWDCGASGRRIIVTSLTNVTLRQRAGYPQVTITGAVNITGSWTNIAAGVYEKTISGLEASAVTYLYGTINETFDTWSGVGSLGGYLKRVSTNTVVSSTDLSWSISGTTLRIKYSGLSAAPLDSTVNWVRSGKTTPYQGINLVSCTNCTVSKLWFTRTCTRWNDGANGYGVLGNTCTGCSIVSCVSFDGDDHNFGFLTSPNCSIIDCIGDGCGAVAPDSSFVYYAAAANTVTGARITNCKAIVRGLYDLNGANLPADIIAITSCSGSAGTVTVVTTEPHNLVAGQSVTIAGATPSGYNATANVVSVADNTHFTYSNATTGASSGTITCTINFQGAPAGFWAHTNASGGSATNYIDDIEYRGCTAVVDPQFYLGATNGWAGSTYPFTVSGCRPVMGDDFNPLSYPMRVYDSTVINGMGTSWTTGTNIAFVRCTLTNNGATTNDYFRWNANAYGVYGFQAGSTNSTILFQACDIYNTCQATDTNPQYTIFGWGYNDGDKALRYRFEKCTIRDNTNPKNQVDARGTFFSQPWCNVLTAANASASDCIVRQCLLASVGGGTRTKVRVVGGSCTFADTNAFKSVYQFHGCWYYGFDSSVGYADNPATLDSKADWSGATTFQAGMDPGGTYDVDPLFVSSTAANVGVTGASTVRTVTVKSGNPEVVGVNGRVGNNIGCLQFGGNPRRATP